MLSLKGMRTSKHARQAQDLLMESGNEKHGMLLTYAQQEERDPSSSRLFMSQHPYPKK